jgi:hypothetical protein
MLRVLMLCGGLLGTVLFLSHSKTVDAGWSQLSLVSPNPEVLKVKKDGDDNDDDKSCKDAYAQRPSARWS